MARESPLTVTIRQSRDKRSFYKTPPMPWALKSNSHSKLSFYCYSGGFQMFYEDSNSSILFIFNRYPKVANKLHKTPDSAAQANASHNGGKDG